MEKLEVYLMSLMLNVLVVATIGCSRKQSNLMESDPKVISESEIASNLKDTIKVVSLENDGDETSIEEEKTQTVEEPKWIYLELDELEIMIPNATDSIAKAINEISASVDEGLAGFQINDSDGFYYLESVGIPQSLWVMATIERNMFLPLEKQWTRIGYVTIEGRELDVICHGNVPDNHLIYEKCRKTGKSKTFRYWNNPLPELIIGEMYNLNVTDTAIVLDYKIKAE